MGEVGGLDCPVPGALVGHQFWGGRCVADLRPGVTHLSLRHPFQKQGQNGGEHMTPDPVLHAVIHGPDVDPMPQAPERFLNPQELLANQGFDRNEGYSGKKEWDYQGLSESIHPPCCLGTLKRGLDLTPNLRSHPSGSVSSDWTLRQPPTNLPPGKSGRLPSKDADIHHQLSLVDV
jgi:hypothetical protein